MLVKLPAILDSLNQRQSFAANKIQHIKGIEFDKQSDLKFHENDRLKSRLRKEFHGPAIRISHLALSAKVLRSVAQKFLAQSHL